MRYNTQEVHELLMSEKDWDGHEKLVRGPEVHELLIRKT